MNQEFDVSAVLSNLATALNALTDLEIGTHETGRYQSLTRAQQHLAAVHSTMEAVSRAQRMIAKSEAPIVHADTLIGAIRQAYNANEECLCALAYVQQGGHHTTRLIKNSKLIHTILLNAITNIGEPQNLHKDGGAPPIPKAGEAYPPPASTWNENKEWHKAPSYVAYMMENGSWLMVEGDQPFSVPSLQEATVFGSEEKLTLSDNIGPLLPIRVAYVRTVRVCELQQS